MHDRPPCSQDYQHVPQAVAAMAKQFPDGFVIAPHAHARAQLLYATTGVMRVSANGQLWVIPPLRAVWVPGGVEHDLQMVGNVTMRTLYIDQNAAPWLYPDCRVIEVSPLLRELILAALEPPHGGGRADLIGKLVLCELENAAEVKMHIPMPKAAPLSLICKAMLADPGCNDTLERWAERMHASGRTLARHFVDETGLSFGKWRQQVRLAEAVCRLAAGQSSKQIAHDLGYLSISAFTAMFRKSLGQAPQNYFSGKPVRDHPHAPKKLLNSQ
jgi:AraC-like DNA-binding protein